MAHILELSDGTTTIDFLDSSGTSWCLLEDGGLLIENPGVRETWSQGAHGYSGRVLSGVTYENRRVELTFEIVGDDWDDIFDMKNSIASLINQAQVSQLIMGTTAPVYLKFQIDTTSNPVYFDVKSGKVSLPGDIMSVEKLLWEKGTQYTLKGCTLELTCAPFARGDEVTLVNGTTINAADDDYYNNYVALTGSSIDGDVPGPLRVRALGGNTHSINNMWVGLRDVATVSSFVNVLEAEDGTYVTYGGTLSSQSVNYSGDPGTGSGGYAVTYSKTAAGGVAPQYNPLVSWNPSSGSAQNIKGRVRVLAVGTFPTTSKFGFCHLHKVGTPAEPVFVRGQGAGILDLGIYDLVPYSVEYGDTTEARTFYIMYSADDTSAQAITLDAVYFLPADDYKFRKYIEQHSSGLGSSIQGFEDLGNPDVVRLVTGSTNVSHSVDRYGLPLHVNPGQDSRLYFMFTKADSSYLPAAATTVYVYHTPYYYDVRGT